MLWERLLALAVLATAGGVAVASVWPEGPPAVAGAGALALTATPVPLNLEDRAQTQVGALTFMGALRLTSPDPLFGGLSGLRFRGGWLLAVSDTGNWLAFQPVEWGSRLIGLRNGRIAPIPMADGRSAADKAIGDAEALEWREDGGAAVVFEQDHRLAVWPGVDPARPDSLGQAPAQVHRYTQAIAWPRNGGGEAFARLDAGADLLISEQGRGADGSHDVLLLSDGGNVRLGLFPPRGFSPTDAVLLDRDRLLLLTRRYDGVSIAARLLLVDLVGLNAARVSGKVPADLILPVRELATLAPPLTLDNMEGLAQRCENGAVMLYLVSDDNLSPAQRTLLMKFRLDPGVSGRACAPPP